MCLEHLGDQPARMQKGDPCTLLAAPLAGADLEPLEADENLPPAALSAPGLQTQLQKVLPA